MQLLAAEITFSAFSKFLPIHFQIYRRKMLAQGDMTVKNESCSGKQKQAPSQTQDKEKLSKQDAFCEG